MKSGFSLIEIVIGIAISSIISLALFNNLYQSYRSDRVVTKITSIDTRAAILHQQLSSDLVGMFIPEFVAKETVGDKQDANSGTNNSFKKDDDAKSTKDAVEKKLLYSINHDSDLLKELTFITCNPLSVYNEAKPRVARVIYSLEESIKHKGSFIFYRQESQNLNYKESKEDAQKFIVANNIKKLSFTYHFNADDDAKKQDLKKLKQLDFGNEQDEKEKIENIPNYIEINLLLWDSHKHQDDRVFKFWLQLYPASKSGGDKEAGAVEIGKGGSYAM